jgi:UDP-4-amino-4,6-dideoxy-N-acetyl-beta-L-altrosamine N-acetyltransferase
MIALRDVCLDDRERMLAWRNLPEVAKFMYTAHAITTQEHGAWFNRMIQDPTKKYWIIEQEGVGVGVANLEGIDQVNRYCLWALYTVPPASPGVGIATCAMVLRYAFEKLNLHKVGSTVLAFNKTACLLHKRFEFSEEGRFREHINKNGTWHDVVYYALLQSEWQTSERRAARVFDTAEINSCQ